MSISTTAAIDLFLGLAFLFFLLSVVASAVNEGLAQVLNLRAKTLERGIRNLLDDPDATESAARSWWERAKKLVGRGAPAAAPNTESFYAHSRIRALQKPQRLISRRDRKPSYIPSRTFVLAVLDVFGKEAAASSQPALVARAHKAAEKLQPTEAAPTAPPLHGMLHDALAEAEGDAAKLRAALEESYNEVMDRVSGWYKRHVQMFLFVIALVLVGAVNADAYAIGQRLWKDAPLRTAVAAQATKAVADKKGCAAGGESATAKAAKCVDSVQELGIPLGWSRATTPQTASTDAGKAVGLLVTVFAIMLGAPFWFDLLGKVAQLRGSGPSPKDTNKSVTAAQS